MATPFIDLGAQQARVKREIDSAISRVLKHGKYILGPEVDELEERLAAYAGTKYCVTCANGTDAIQLALMAIGVGPGDEVVTPAFSYIAAAEATTLLGARPVYVDVEADYFTLDVSDLENALSERTKAIIPVSLFGQCADMDAINAVADRHGVVVIEDAAQSFGASVDGTKSCALSSIATTSFFPAKPLGCYGDGGAVFTSDEELAGRIRRIARHGQSARYRHEIVGINSRLDTLQAAILLEKLKIFDSELLSRRVAASNYTHLIMEISKYFPEGTVEAPCVRTNQESSWAQYTLKLHARDHVKEFLDLAGIPSMVYYPLPLTRQPAVSSDARKVPVAEVACDSVLSLPMHPYLSDAIQIQVVDELQKAIQRAAC